MSNKYVAGYEPDLTSGKFHPSAFFDPAVEFANAGDPEAAAAAQAESPVEIVESIEVVAGNAIAVAEVKDSTVTESATPEGDADASATDGETGGAPAEPVSPEQTEVKFS